MQGLSVKRSGGKEGGRVGWREGGTEGGREARRNRGRKGGREGGGGREGERKGVSRDFKRAILQSEVGSQSIAIDSSDCLLRHKQIKRRNLHKTSLVRKIK